jgi:hypothetical protein
MTLYIAIGVTVALILGGAFILGILWIASNYPGQIESVKNVFIIALALESCIFGVVLMLMLVMLMRLVNMLEFEIKPILEQTNETVGTVRGTTTFVSKNVVRPVVRVKGYVAAMKRGTKALFGNPRGNLPE